MNIKLICPKCYKGFKRARTENRCPRCGDTIKVDAVKIKEPLEVCPVCDLSYFYIEKNFPKKLSMIIIFFAIGLFITLQIINPSRWNIVVPGVFFILDTIAYILTGDRTVCYNCLTEFSGVRTNPEHKEYDLTIASRFVNKE